MKKIVIGVLIIVIIFLVVRSQFKTNINNISLQINKVPTKPITSHYSLRPKVDRPLGETTSYSQSIFVPYWAGEVNEKDRLKYDTFYYFGVSPTSSGALRADLGLQNISIIEKIPEKQKKLVLRMLDASITEVILGDGDAQKKLSIQLKAILENKEFSGIVFDIEVPFTLQADKKGKITYLVQQICTAIKSDYKTCDMLVYGDYSYRKRPYDLQALGAVVDKILLMAYDFHKAGGEQGPNFSFNEKQKYRYDFMTMIQDTLALVPKEKIEVVFGMYGYDWTLNEQGTPLKSATALSLNSIKLKVKSEKLKVESNSAKEKYINYTDSEGKKHIIWYEDEESAAVKIKYLLESGISQVSFWAYSYY